MKAKKFFANQQNIYMVLELVKGKELFDKIAEIEHYDENIARKIFKELILAIQYLHRKKISHRDIKPSNIMVLDSDSTKIKLIDLNVSKQAKNDKFEMMTHTGTEAFSAPEMFSQTVYNEKIDIWSAGCVLYTMLAGH